VHGQHQHLGGGEIAADALDQVHSRHPRHGQVQHHHIGLVTAQGLDHFVAGAGLGHHLNVELRRQQTAQAFTQHLVVIGQHHGVGTGDRIVQDVPPVPARRGVAHNRLIHCQTQSCHEALPLHRAP
jgi:hypothetical protein